MVQLLFGCSDQHFPHDISHYSWLIWTEQISELLPCCIVRQLASLKLDTDPRSALNMWHRFLSVQKPICELPHCPFLVQASLFPLKQVLLLLWHVTTLISPSMSSFQMWHRPALVYQWTHQLIIQYAKLLADKRKGIHLGSHPPNGDTVFQLYWRANISMQTLGTSEGLVH